MKSKYKYPIDKHGSSKPQHSLHVHTLVLHKQLHHAFSTVIKMVVLTLQKSNGGPCDYSTPPLIKLHFTPGTQEAIHLGDLLTLPNMMTNYHLY